MTEKKNIKKIILDSTILLSPLTGIGKYINEVSKYLEDEKEIDISYFYGYYSKKRIKVGMSSEIKSIRSLIVRSKLLKKIVIKILNYMNSLFASNFDLYWVPNFIQREGIKASKIVTTVHDISFYLNPEWHSQETIDEYNKYFYKQLKQFDWIITVSEFSKNEIIEHLQFDKNRITVIYNGVDHELYKIYDSNVLYKTKIKFQLEDSFFLFVGSIEPRKNLLKLIQAYGLLPFEVKDKYPLVLVGFKGWENKEIMQEIDKDKEHIRYLGYLSDEELAHVYNLASLFIYPSFYEGFGIPPLEAMACGTPVIVSSVSSLPEICKDAALYIDPYSANDISKQIQTFLIDKALEEKMIKKGLAHVKTFTWEKSAKKHIEVFNEVMASKD